MGEKKLRIGTRGSPLALYQANLVKTLVLKTAPDFSVEIVTIKTSGDREGVRSVNPFETKRVFTREIEDALLGKSVDLAVHSAKDVAAVLPPGLKVGAVLEREDVRDCVLTPDGKTLRQLKAGARVGTSSLRRKAQVIRLCPGVQVPDLQGNVDTRIAKMLRGDYEAIVLAYAGVKRIGLTQKVSEMLDPQKFYPAPGQGAILVETREKDALADEALRGVHDAPSALVLQCERSFLRHLEGGCQLPCGMWTRVENGRIEAGGALFSPDGLKAVEAHVSEPADHPHQAGVRLADMLLNQGGDAIIEKLRRSQP
ncbi:MAG TPA: hydroxymethylbilane synthase [Verrucomicrobiae bacterium]|jgi:hydroxymethylbilane synthase|nr:hydroxymethylbilane synthase [Verrucomicrobiae bacterium]